MTAHLQNTSAQTIEGTKPVRKFTSYEEYLREFFPNVKDTAATNESNNGNDFGVALALESLTRHGDILRFGR